jgi:hypothetical protein
LEELRDLSWPEFNFQNIGKVHLKKLLNIQSTYWKNRCTIHLVKFGGENTKYFHAKATERYMHNNIAEIQNEEEITFVDHNDKAEAFWNCFK